MSEDGFSQKDREGLERLTQDVMQQLAAGRRTDDIVRDLNASGWAKDVAERLVETIQQHWEQIQNSPEAKSAAYLQMRFPEMRPVRSAPTLFTFNGIGTQLYGARDRDPETGTYVETVCFCILFIPVLALKALRVARAEDGSRFLLGQVPLSRFAKSWNVLVLCAVLGLIAYGGWTSYSQSDDYQAGRKLAEADRAVAAGNLLEASFLYAELARSTNRHSATARQKLAKLAESPTVDKLPVADVVLLFDQVVLGCGSDGSSSVVFARGLELVKRHARAAPEPAANLLAAIAPLATPEACQAFAELMDGPLADQPPAETLAAFRAAVKMPRQEEQRRTLAGLGLNQSTRLAVSDLPAALELLAVIAPLGDPTAVDERVKTLLGPPLDAAACATVGRALGIAHSIGGSAGESWVIERGLKWLDDHPQADPREALALADQLAPFPSADAGRIAAARRRQLERLVAAAPQDLEPAIQLALLLESDTAAAARIETLLTPHRDKLGTGEGARMLGQRLAAQGKFDESYQLLAPYLEKRLDAFHAAEQAYEDALKQAQERAFGDLKTGRAPGFNYAKFEAAAESEKQSLLADYLRQALNDDAGVAAASTQLAQQAAVVPVALDLGMVTLQRARNMDDPEARRADLERAEKTFLAVRGVAGDTDQYRLHLGQVYYWLGKHEEGRREFDELLASHGRESKFLLAVANVLRDLGAVADARPLMEEAYEKTSNAEEKQSAAYLRAITNVDLDDRSKWLERCDQNASQIRALLADVRGDREAVQGNKEKAAERYREAAAIYEREAKNAATYNNGALAYLSLFAMSGEREALDRGQQWLEQAVALSPSDALVLTNAASVLQRAAIQDLAGAELNLHELQNETIPVLNYLARDQQTLDALRRRAREHAGLARALNYLDQATVLSPKNPTLYLTAMQVHSFRRDAEALRRLTRQVAAAQPDLRQSNAEIAEYSRYEDDDSSKTARASAIKQAQALVERQSQTPASPSFAAAVGRLVDLSLSAPDAAALDADDLVRLATQAHQAARSRATYWPLIESLMFRAARSLREAHPRFAKATATTGRSLPPSSAVVLAASFGDALGESARRNPDVQQAGELATEWTRTFPDATSVWSWALLRAVHPDRANAQADYLAHDQVDQLERELYLQLMPVAGTSACYEYWGRLVAGREEEAFEPVQRVVDAGIPFPMDLIKGRQ